MFAVLAVFFFLPPPLFSTWFAGTGASAPPEEGGAPAGEWLLEEDWGEHRLINSVLESGSFHRYPSPTATSAVFFDENHSSNFSFRTVGTQSVFNAEAQAAEYALYTLPIANCTIVADSKSVVDAMCKLQNIAQQYNILLPKNATLLQIQQFATKIMYKYRKSHRYATVLQSILTEVLIRQMQGFIVKFIHVYSHLLDHQYISYNTHHMPQEERQRKLAKLQAQYNHDTMFLLEGNFMADRMCEEPVSDTTIYPIQIHAAALPRFVLKDIHNCTYASADTNSFVKTILNRIRIEEMLADHPELELTKFSPETDWNASIWPLNDKANHNNKLISFQYKLKSETLMTPARRFIFQTETKSIPKLQSAQCPVCKHPTEEADIQHIFSSCTVAARHNKSLWQSIQSLLQEHNCPSKPWFTTETEGIREQKAQTKHNKNVCVKAG